MANRTVITEQLLTISNITAKSAKVSLLYTGDDNNDSNAFVTVYYYNNNNQKRIVLNNETMDKVSGFGGDKFFEKTIIDLIPNTTFYADCVVFDDDFVGDLLSVATVYNLLPTPIYTISDTPFTITLTPSRIVDVERESVPNGTISWTDPSTTIRNASSVEKLYSGFVEYNYSEIISQYPGITPEQIVDVKSLFTLSSGTTNGVGEVFNSDVTLSSANGGYSLYLNSMKYNNGARIQEFAQGSGLNPSMPQILTDIKTASQSNDKNIAFQNLSDKIFLYCTSSSRTYNSFALEIYIDPSKEGDNVKVHYRPYAYEKQTENDRFYTKWDYSQDGNETATFSWRYCKVTLGETGKLYGGQEVTEGVIPPDETWSGWFNIDLTRNPLDLYLPKRIYGLRPTSSDTDADGTDDNNDTIIAYMEPITAGQIPSVTGNNTLTSEELIQYVKNDPNPTINSTVWKITAEENLNPDLVIYYLIQFKVTETTDDIIYNDPENDNVVTTETGDTYSSFCTFPEFWETGEPLIKGKITPENTDEEPNPSNQIVIGNYDIQAQSSTAFVYCLYEGDSGSGNDPAKMYFSYRLKTQGDFIKTDLLMSRDTSKKRHALSITGLLPETEYIGQIRVVDADGIEGEEAITVKTISEIPFTTTAVVDSVDLGTIEILNKSAFSIQCKLPYSMLNNETESAINLRTLIQWKKSTEVNYNAGYNLSATDGLGYFLYTINGLLQDTEYKIKFTVYADKPITGTNPQETTESTEKLSDTNGDGEARAAKPTLTAPNGGESWSGSNNVTWTLSTTDFTKANQKTEIQIYDGQKYPSQLTESDWAKNTPIITALGAESKSVNFSNYDYTEVGMVRIRSIGYSGGVAYRSDWDYSDGVFTIEGDLNPTKPTNLYPDDGEQLGYTDIIRFSWQHNAPKRQTKAVLSYRKTGQAWTNVNINNGNQYYNMPADTLTAGFYDWKVVTYSLNNIGVETASPSSDLALFQAVLPSETPVIVYPADSGTVTSTPLIVDWTVTEQNAFAVRLFDETNNVEVYDSGNITGVSTLYQIPYTLEHGNDYTVYVKTANNEDIWSEEDSAAFIVVFTPPNKPTLQVYPNTFDNVMECYIDNPNGGVGVLQNNLYRFASGESEAIVLGTDVGNAFIDYYAGSGVTYYYYVETIGENGSVVYSAIVSSTLEFTGNGIEIRQAAFPELKISLPWFTDISVDPKSKRQYKEFAGNEYPVAYSNGSKSLVVNINAMIATNKDMSSLERMNKDNLPVIYKDYRGRVVYGMLDFTINDEKQDERYSCNITVTKIKADNDETTTIPYNGIARP